MTVSRALVVGGGIGGLAAATALAQRGVEVDVAERREAFAIPGVGLGQPANALRALRSLGVLDEIAAAGFPFSRLRVYGPDGELVVDHRFRLGGDVPPFIALPRTDLHRILFDAATAAGVKVRMATEPRQLRQNGGVAVGFEGGGEESFDLLAGFDGYRSWTRQTILGPGQDPRFSGYAAWRLIVPRPSEVTCMRFHQGIGHKTGVMPLNENSMYLFHIRPEAPGLRVSPAQAVDGRRERLADYGGFVAELREALRDDDTVVYSPLEPLFVPAPWHRGRVAIGGDAAHTYPPHMTQGAAMALEDAVVLAQQATAEGTGTVEERLGGYAERRLARCRYVEEFAGRMLRDEQKISSLRDFEHAKASAYDDLDGRLTGSDRVMDEDVLDLGAGVAA